MSPQVIQPNSNPQPQTPPEPNAVETPVVVSPQITPTSPVPSVYPASLAPNPSPSNFAQPTLAQPFSGDPPTPPKRFKFGSKKILIIAAAVFVLLGGSSAAYFGYVLPNQPDHLWATALSNTGKGYDTLTKYITAKKSGKSAGFKGDFKLSGFIAADGSFEGATDGSNSNLTATLSAVGLKTNLDVRSIKPSSSSTPDIYFKVDGIQSLGSLVGGDNPQITKALNSLNNTWYFVDHTLFDQFAQGANTNLQFSSSDTDSILKAVGKANNENIFTKDPKKMAFTVSQNVGKEKQDGRSVYHYKVGVNKQNIKNYINNLCSNLKDSSLKKLFNGDSSATEDAIGCKDAAKTIDSQSSNDKADVWVDTRTKLIHKIRFTDKSSPDSYLDISQDYQGGTSFPFELSFQDKSGGSTASGDLKLTLNTKSNELKINGSAKSEGQSGSFNLTVSPSNNAVKVDKPANARSIIELLSDVGLDNVYDIANSTPSAKNTERKTDINALHGQVEAYFAENGVYPTLAQMNSPQWRAANMKGLDDAALQDPDGTSKTLGSSPAKNIYSYQTSPAGCDNQKVDCTNYTLTATLSDGSTYVKQDLNGPATILQ